MYSTIRAHNTIQTHCTVTSLHIPLGALYSQDELPLSCIGCWAPLASVFWQVKSSVHNISDHGIDFTFCRLICMFSDIMDACYSVTDLEQRRYQESAPSQLESPQ